MVPTTEYHNFHDRYKMIENSDTIRNLIAFLSLQITRSLLHAVVETRWYDGTSHNVFKIRLEVYFGIGIRIHTEANQQRSWHFNLNVDILRLVFQLKIQKYFILLDPLAIKGILKLLQ